MNLSSLLLLGKISKIRKEKNDNQAKAAVADKSVKSKRQLFTDWMSSKPEPIKLFPGETEIFRKGLVLVTDTRLAYILNRRLCKGLLVFSVLAFLVILAIDILDSNSRTFFLVYIPLIAGILIAIKVWNDMKPRYVIHWRMRDLTYGEIVQEPYPGERMMGNREREMFMNNLADAMNQALSAKSWWPGGQLHASLPDNTSEDTEAIASAEKPTLKLVTENYQ